MKFFKSLGITKANACHGINKRRLLTVPASIVVASILTVTAFADMNANIASAKNAIVYSDASRYSSAWNNNAGAEGLRVYLVKNTGEDESPSRGKGEIYNSYDILRDSPTLGEERFSTAKNMHGGNTKFDYIKGVSLIDELQKGYNEGGNILVYTGSPSMPRVASLACSSKPNIMQEDIDKEVSENIIELQDWLKSTKTLHTILNDCYSGTEAGKLGCTCSNKGTHNTSAEYASCPLIKKVIEQDLKLIYEPLVLVRYLDNRYALTGTEFWVLSRDFSKTKFKDWKMANWCSPTTWKGKAVPYVQDITTTDGYIKMKDALAHYNKGEVRVLDIDEDEDGDGWRHIAGFTDTQEQTACISGYSTALAKLDATNPKTTCNWVDATISMGMGESFSTNVYKIIRFAKSDLGLLNTIPQCGAANAIISGGVAIGSVYF